MYLESFRHLIEIQGLKEINHQEEKLIMAQKKRISDLTAMREKRARDISELEEKLKSHHLKELQLSIESASQRLKKMQGQMDLVSNQKEQQALEHQTATLQAEISNLENAYFEKLELSEKIELEIKEGLEFLNGSLETLEHISKEVENVCLIHQKKIEQNNNRINSLLEPIHPSLKSYYLELDHKFKSKKATAFLLDRECSMCHMLQDTQLKSSLEKGVSIETCGNCGRLLIPETSRIY